MTLAFGLLEAVSEHSHARRFLYIRADDWCSRVKQLNPAARAYVLGVIALGAAILCIRAPQMSFGHPWLFAMLFILSCASATMKITLPLTTNVSTMSVSYAIDFASLLLVGADLTMLVAAASAFSQCVLNIREKPPLHRTLFSMSTLIVTVAGAGVAFNQLSAPGADAITSFARPLVSAATVYFLLNSGLIAGAIALASRQAFFTIWQTNFLWSGPSYFVGAGAAALAAWIVNRIGFWLAPLTFAPIYLTYRTYSIYLGRLEAQRHLQETSDLHLATIEALAAAIDAKDQMTRVHIRRVQAYASGLAEALELSQPEIQAVQTAALLHDIGKLAIPAHILSKPGPLTPEEFAKVRIHPQIGAEIIASVPFPYPVAPIILSHHERWDGTGYPQALRGEAIPIGARIISIVDYFDVVTSKRPYHAAQSIEGAVALLRLEAGKALDPKLVDLFIDRLPEFAARFEDDPRTRAVRAVVSGSAQSPAEPTAFENIALAHQEIYALYEIAQAMGTSLGVSDTMDLISSKLAPLIPWSGCALFLQEPDSNGLACRYARGSDVTRLLRSRIRLGEGLSGWVARHRSTLVNANPRIEFDAAGLKGDIASRSAIVCQLASGERFIGTLMLVHTDADRYTDDHRRLLARVAEQAAAVLNNSIVFEQTQEDSLTDPLTGLPNRRSLMARMSTEISRAERLEHELAVIVLDVDRFKEINDSYGHAVGDEVLREISRTLLNTLRPYDMCVRFAGDEFVIVLGECPPEAAELKRQELQQRIEEITVTVDAAIVSVGASAGAAVYPHDGHTCDALLATADRRMYGDKATRRRTGHPAVTSREREGTTQAALVHPPSPSGVSRRN
jgi:diguanylate cyclase (GGDEF)-like protein/putative nucleotidyltransferase with HDIG domain